MNLTHPSVYTFSLALLRGIFFYYDKDSYPAKLSMLYLTIPIIKLYKTSLMTTGYIGKTFKENRATAPGSIEAQWINPV